MEQKNLLSDLQGLAVSAHNWVSFSPERRGASIIAECSAELAEDLERLSSLNATDEQWERYAAAYRSKLSHWLHAKSRTASSAITGGGNFPVRQQQKRHAWERNANDNFRQWREKVLAAYEKYARKDARRAAIDAAGSESALYRRKLANLVKRQEMMKAANAVIRSKKTTADEKRAGLEKLGFEAATITSILTPDWLKRCGFKTFELTNNNARIKQTEQRIKEIEQREALAAKFAEQAAAQTEAKSSDAVEAQQAAAAPGNVFLFPGGKITIDYADNRVRIQHDAVPDDEVRRQLKKNGFNWSRFNTAWQRQITGNAFYAVERVTGVKIGR